MRGVDGGFPADARVHHCQQCCRDLDDAHTAHAVSVIEHKQTERAMSGTYNVAATNPTRSPMTPPPRARITVSRVHLLSSKKSSIAALPSRLLDVSPGAIMWCRNRFAGVSLEANSAWKSGRWN
jgi:hypothetical protein